MAPVQKKITIALGGGGARGFAHLGVLEVLEKHFEIKAIVGTSMGALVGAVYAQHGSAAQAIAHFQKRIDTLQDVAAPEQHEPLFDELSAQFRRQILFNGISAEKAKETSAQIQIAVNHLLYDNDIQETNIPFAAIATDAISGQENMLTKGNIQKAVFASSALPGVTEPVVWEDKLLIDGAATSAVPIRAARRFANHFIIASDVSAALTPRQTFRSAAEIFIRNLQIISRHYHDELVKEADLLIEPQVGEKPWNHFENIEWFIEHGRKAACDTLNKM